MSNCKAWDQVWNYVKSRPEHWEELFGNDVTYLDNCIVSKIDSEIESSYII